MAEIKHERQYTTQAELDQMERELTEAEETLATRSGSRRKHKVKAGTVVFIIALACVLLLLGKVWIDKSAGRVPEQMCIRDSIDDIYTTGATVGECVRILADAGANVTAYTYSRE